MKFLITVPFIVALIQIYSISNGDEVVKGNNKYEDLKIIWRKDPLTEYKKISKLLGLGPNEDFFDRILTVKMSTTFEYPYLKECSYKVKKELRQEVDQINSPAGFLKRKKKYPVMFSVPMVAFSSTKVIGVKPKFLHPGIPIAVYPQHDPATNDTQLLVEYVFCSSKPNPLIDINKALILNLTYTTYCDPNCTLLEDSRRQITTPVSFKNGEFGDTYVLSTAEKNKLSSELLKKYDVYYNNWFCSFCD